MELKLNISKKGLNISAEVINEEFTLNYGHIFRGKSAYEHAVDGGFAQSEGFFNKELANINKCIEVDFRAAQALLNKGSNDQFAKLYQELYNNDRKAIVMVDSTNNRRIFATVGGYLNASSVRFIRIDAFYTSESFSVSNVMRTYIWTYSVNIWSDGSISLAELTKKQLVDGNAIADNLSTLDSQSVLSANQGALLNGSKVGGIEVDRTTGEVILLSNNNIGRAANNEIGRIKIGVMPITYTELRELKNNGMLQAGLHYRITDFMTKTIQSNTRSAGHPFDIIVQALDSHTLSEDARAIQHDGDTYFAKSNLKAWSLKYALDGDTSRFAWAQTPARPQSWSCAWGVLESKENNEASSNYEQATIDGKSKYLYRPAEPTSHLQGKQFYRDVVISSITSPEGFIYEADSAPSQGEDYYNYPSEIRVKTASGKQVALFTRGYDNYYYDENNSEYYITFGSSYQEVDGVYQLTPESGVEDWWEYVVGGSIEETERKYYNGAVDSLYYAFDTILPKSSKTVTEVTDKVHIYKTGGTIDTITYQSYISEEDGGKGVIYQLIDEFGNDCSYDFKNIQFNDNNVYYYTFSSSGNDASLNGTVRDNILMPYSGSLLTTIFKGAAIGNKIQRKNGSKAFVFEKSAIYNDILATTDTAKISAKGNFDANVLLIRSELTTNGAFSNNYVQYLSSNTTINGDFYANQLDTLNRNSVPLTINCGRIQQCTIYGCGTFSIANTNGSTTGTMGYSTINLGMNGSNVKLLWNTTASLNNRIEGLNIKAYNWGTSEVAVDITNHPANATYPLTIAKNKNGEVKIFCEADLV